MRPDDPAATVGMQVQAGLASLAHPALLIDRDGRIASANRSVRRLFGRPDESLVGRPVTDLIPDLVSPELEALFASARGAHRREVSGVRADQARIPLRLGIGRVRQRRKPFLLLTLTDLSRRKLLEAADRDSRYGFRLLAQSLPQILWAWRPDGLLEYIAPQWIAFTGAPFESQLGHGWLTHLHPEDRAAIALARDEAIQARQPFKVEFRVRRHDGEHQWFVATMVPMLARDGTFIRWLGTMDNNHEARLTRMELTAERDRFARLIASVPGAVYAYRLGPNGEESFPLSTAGITEFVGMSPRRAALADPATIPRIHGDDVDSLRTSIRESARNLTPWRGEWRVHHPQRGETWVEARAVPMRDEDGGTVWHGLMMDITQRKRAEEELQRSQARLRAAVMASGIGTYIWDLTTGRVWWDDMLLQLFGRTREEVERGGIENAANFVQPEDRPLAAQAMQPVIDGKSDTLSVEYRSLRHDGALQWIAVQGRVDRDASGKITRLTGACLDITARKRAEESRRNSQKIEALGTLAGGIAHDFNNLLLAIAGNTQLAMADLPTGHVVQRSLEEIERASARASDLVHRILAFSHQSEPKRAIVALRPTIEEAQRLLRATLPAIVEIRSEFAAQPLFVDADSTQIHQIVMNLVTNSAHAIGEHGGIVSVVVESQVIEPGDSRAPAELMPGTYARIRVSDNGCGMDKATLDRIFDPFFTTKPVGQGTGLGLSVVHGIVRAHHGAITVRSEPGAGATFDVYLPAAAGSPEVAVEPPESALGGRGQRILYVDDEDSLVFLVTRVLERTGYFVSGFVDPAQALQAFEAAPANFDAVVTDLSMPRMSGFTLARAMLAIRPDIPVFMTSGYVSPQDREAALRLGIRELILKPDTIDELGRALENLFKAHQPS